MARRGRHRKGGRVTPKGTRPPGSRGAPWPPPPDDDEPELMGDVRRALLSGEPIDLLGQVSGLLTLVDPREYGFGRRPGDAPPYALRDLVEMFLDAPRIETSALLAVIAELMPDELQAARIRRELNRRLDPLPRWLDRLGEAEVHTAVEMVHVLRDGDNVNLGVRFDGGQELTAVVYIDHNVGTIVKDAFVVAETIGGLETLMRTKVDDPDTGWRPLDLADARVRVTEAIEKGAITVPPFETETWPSCRPFVEWLTRRMPDGGTGYERPTWSERDLDELADRFFASSHGADLDDTDHRSLLGSVLWFGTDYGPGDPMRWSPVVVEIILDDWIPRKLAEKASYLTKAPDLLRAFVRFCHAERGIRAELTTQTLDAIDLHEPDYQRVIRSDRPHGPLALLAAMGVIDPDGPWGDDDDFDEAEHAEMVIDGLRASAGGDDALWSLDDESLPDEEFDWYGIAADIRPALGEILALCDGCCDEMLDAEYRTACRRLLARAAAGDPEVFRRRGRPATAAAAICWIVAKDNDLFRLWGAGLMVKDLLAYFGLRGSVSQRANVIMTAAGFDPYARLHEIRLGAPELLVAARRSKLMELRDEYMVR